MLCLVCQEMIEDARARAGATKCAQCDGQQPEGTMIPDTAAPDVTQRVQPDDVPFDGPTQAPIDQIGALRAALAEATSTLSRVTLELYAISDFAETL